MAANETVLHTDSEKTSSYEYMKKTVVQLTIKFKIEEFEALMTSTKPGEGLMSKEVSSQLAPRAVWKLEVYPNGESEQEKGNVSVFLHLTGPMKDNGENLDVTCYIYLLVDKSGGSKIDVMERRDKNFGKEHNAWGEDASHSQVRKALHADGSLVVAADIDFLAPDDSAPHVDLQQWPAKFSRFYGDAASSDCSIEIGGETIPAHKLFLMACSPVFEEMFTNPAAEEAKSGVVKITDFQRPEPMRALVRYCYQGHLDNATLNGDGAVEIFQLANKYCIDDLKAHMEEHFINKRLSVENVIEMVKLADMHSADELKMACIDLIAEEWDTVSESAEWKRLEEKMPELADELVKAATAEE